MLERAIEELTLNAWPPLETLFFDGWILSFSNGYTRRANSIHSLYPSALAISDKIVACEATYAGRGREVTFKLTSSPSDADLDTLLNQRGYARVRKTSVQTCDLATPAAQDATDVGISAALTDRWFADFNRLTLAPDALHASERQLLDKIGPPHAFGWIAMAGKTVALGLAVAERGHVGLFDIVVDGAVRNQGLGRRLCSRLLQWGRDDYGATTGYLAVMADNAPALKLYANLGFREAYTYWYRHPSRSA